MEKGRFALVGPPADMAHLYAILDHFRRHQKRFSSTATLLKLAEWMPPFKSAEFNGIVSAAGQEAKGFLVLCPVLAEMVATMDGEGAFREHLVQRIFQACKVAAEEGAGIVALGAFTSIAVIGREEELSRESGTAVTSGNTLTAWLTVQGIRRAVEAVGLDLKTSRAAVIGASGDIGRGVCHWLAQRVSGLTLSARRLAPLEDFAAELRRESVAVVDVTGDNAAAVRGADIVVTAARSTTPVIQGRDVRPGTIVCDVGYPKNVGAELEGRPDVLAFSGGYARLPFMLDFGHDSKLPRQDVLYGCFSEAIVLSLEGRYENYSVGRGAISLEKMEEVGRAAQKHGFDVAPFYVGKRLLLAEDIERVAEAREERPAGREDSAKGLEN